MSSISQNKKLVKMVCSHCDGTYYLTQREHKNKVRRGTKRFYCSRECAQASRKNTRYTGKCQYCGKQCSRQYCSVACSNKARATKYVELKFCNLCGKQLNPKSRGINCKQCHINISRFAFYRSMYKTDIDYYLRLENANRYSQIREMARKVYYQVICNNKCEICGYDKHIEVCHIKSISSFNGTDKVISVNHKNNLIGLCPNCHWEFDHGQIDTDIVKSIVSNR